MKRFVLIASWISISTMASSLNLTDILHNSSEIFYANPASGEIRIRAKRGTVAEAYLVDSSKSYKMEIAYQNDQSDFFQVDVGRFDSTFSYKFLVKSVNDSLYVPQMGAFNSRSAVFEIPDWAAGKIYYSVFPDAFFNGDATNDPKDALGWGRKPEKWQSYGGDLAGIILKLAYLDSLDYDILLVQPVTPASSNHKLNPKDYSTVDPAFGDTMVLKVLVSEVHKRQKRIILSMVLTESGTDFPAFTDVLKTGAKSKYAGWYVLTSPAPKPAPGYYDSWLNDYRLPKYNLTDPQLRSFLIGYLEFWQHFGVDGFYVGYDSKINRDLLREIRSTMKSRHPNLLIIGSDSQGITGDGLDGCENAVFNKLLVDFFVKDTITLTEFEQNYRRLLFFNPSQANVANLLSATTPFARIASQAKDDALRMIYAFIFTACGSPVLMYGDEVGLADGALLNPGSFNWNSEVQNRDLLLDIKKLIYIRKTNPQIASKYYFNLYANDLNKVIAYDRGGIITVLNFGPAQAYLELPAWDGSYLDLFSGERFFATGQKLRLSINPKTFRILRRGV